MTDTGYLAVVTTLGSRDEAQRMARALVERRLGACAQISEIQSFYTWEGAVQDDPEYRLLLKTRTALYDDVEAAILELHSYDLPAIHAYPVARLSQPYADWIDESTGTK